MTLIRKTLALALGLSLSLGQAQTAKAQTTPPLLPVTLALDWTPNVNHIGIYVAQQRGWYKAAGVQLTVLPYASTSPEVLVTAGRADVGISGAESVTASAASPNPVISIAAILAKNTAAFAVLKSSAVVRPKQLDGKIYAAFGAPYETPIIQRLIRNDGGQGQFKSPVLSAGGLPALLSKRADFMWIFEGTEGVEARLAGTPLRTFSLTAYGVPDYYTPVLVADPARLAANTPKLRAFLAATARGYAYAERHPAEAAALMLGAVPKGTFPDPKVLTEGTAWLSNHQAYAQSGQPWGQQTLKMWTAYPAFLLKAGAIRTPEGKAVKRLDFDSLFTNKLLPQVK
ncbi:ABC transporter substrate-binding protein [Deinococcus detaillensis]|uniref:Thiamine pyrimidine synthase n=1 Tax=Deinococcus detaillensis TaxID=2592048 RepID=A0A553UQD6_9DEIO|nr:ABC transporter substrate-binding protein [Deinococcus detaillensis]TSA82418.1 ABC transporter substrate-binding protein [Deinococcus detaillensis]